MTERRYHHGDLRNALIEAGLEILEAEGLESLSLRAVAARAGVSHAAPAHHFRNVQALLTNLARVGFERFAEAMAAARARVPAEDHAAQLRAASDGYLAFATTHPALFKLMFSGVMLDWEDPQHGLAPAAKLAFRHLAEIAAPAARAAGDDTPAGHSRLQTLIWSAVHGYARLLIDCPAAIPGETPTAPDLAALLLPPAGSRRGK